MLSIIFVDTAFLHVYSSSTHQIMLLMSLVPLPANAVAIATELRTEPEAVAATVLLSTFFGLVYIPVVITVFQGYPGFVL